MEIQARLIYKSQCTCFESSLPVYFYGLSNGKVVILVASSSTEFGFKSILKWILVENIDFQYDYSSETIFITDSEEIGIDEFMLFADNLEQRVKTIATFGNFSSKAEAQQYLNNNVHNMLISQNQEKYEVEYY